MSIPIENNFSDRELKFSYWYITHKIAIRKWSVISLAVFSFLLWFYVAWGLTFFAVNFERDQLLWRQLASGQGTASAALESERPADLQISQTEILPGANGRYDYLAQIYNPNANWLAEFDYQFTDSASVGSAKRGFVLPGEQKYIFGSDFEGKAASFQISNVSWRRINNFEREYNERFRFEVSNEEFAAGETSGDPNRLVFDLTNHSAYGFWQVGVLAFLTAANGETYANYLELQQLKSGESRSVEMAWPELLPRIVDIEVIPETNIFDTDNIMSPQ